MDIVWFLHSQASSLSTSSLNQFLTSLRPRSLPLLDFLNLKLEPAWQVFFTCTYVICTTFSMQLSWTHIFIILTKSIYEYDPFKDTNSITLTLLLHHSWRSILSNLPTRWAQGRRPHCRPRSPCQDLETTVGPKNVKMIYIVFCQLDPDLIPPPHYFYSNQFWKHHIKWTYSWKDRLWKIYCINEMQCVRRSVTPAICTV